MTHMNEQQIVSANRREFLLSAAGMAAASALFCARPYRAFASPVPPGRKVVIVTFGGGARDDETFSLQGQRNIPFLLNELAPQSCFFTQVVNRGILGHYVATASIATGSYETFDNFVAQPPQHPTLFEYFRKGLHRPREDAWMIAPGQLFSQMGSSADRRYGPSDQAEVIIPKQLLAAALGDTQNSQFDSYLDLLRDNYETLSTVSPDDKAADNAAVERLADRLKISFSQLRLDASKLASPDELSVYILRQVMRQFAPSLIFITLHDIDIAHAGAYSLYLDGIHSTDRLSADIWRAIQSDPEYKDRTTMLILPDFGRDGDDDAGGNGFQHHRTGSPMARTTWMMALGPEVRQGTVVQRVVESIDIAPTVAGLLRFDAPFAQGRQIAELL
jgi:hypothetical protein